MNKKNVYLLFFISIIFCIILTIIFIRINKSKKSNQKNNKNLIFGIIYKYSWSEIRNYFISLAKAGFKNVDIVMFVKEISQDTIEKIRSFGVIIYPIVDNPFLIYKCQRFELYANYLKENKDKYNIVLHTDVRDTIFQNDVFQFYDSDKSFFEASEEDILLKDGINKLWMLQICNRSMFNDYFANQRAICSGLIIGTPDKFIEFSNSIIKLANGTKFGEQRYLNYLIYYEKFFSDSIIIKNNSNTHLMNIAMTKRRRIILDKDNNILNFNGEVASVIHQYDRHWDLVFKMNKKFNDINFNYTIYKEQRMNKNIISKSENKKFGLIIFKIFIIIFIIIILIIYTIKKLKNYYLIQNNKLRRVKIINNKKIRRKIFYAYHKI